MNFIDEKIEQYALEHSSAEPEILQKITRDTHLRTWMPRMLSGHLQGRLLAMLSKMMNPSFILEVGTFTGYSMFCFLEGLKPDGKLISIEVNDELIPYVQTKLNEAGEQRAHIIHGSALEIIPTIEDAPDLVFIDADKKNYPAYWKMIFPKMKSGGIIIADNVLWSGKILDPEKNKDADTQGLMEFTRMALSEPNAEQVLLPVRDGLLIIRKK
ncbi:MAG: O-methyltransferase [Bacteroidia bacterium]